MAALNLALAGKQRGRISDALLKERIASARPVLRDDGNPWGAEDWFACYIGNLQGPAELWPGETESEPPLLLAQLHERYAALVKAHKLRPVTALVQLLSCGKGLNTEQQLAIEGALLQDEPLSDTTLPVLRQLLDDWELSLSTSGQMPGKRRRK